MLSVIKRFFSKIDIDNAGPNDCWVWTSTVNHKGYGQLYVGMKDRLVMAHRFSYEYFYKLNIPAGMVIDHICRNRKCVRPDHLRVFTMKQNALENSFGHAAINSRKTHCKKGHPFAKDNTYYRNRRGNIERECMICNRATLSRWRQRQKLETETVLEVQI